MELEIGDEGLRVVWGNLRRLLRGEFVAENFVVDWGGQLQQGVDVASSSDPNDPRPRPRPSPYPANRRQRPTSHTSYWSWISVSIGLGLWVSLELELELRVSLRLELGLVLFRARVRDRFKSRVRVKVKVGFKLGLGLNPGSKLDFKRFESFLCTQKEVYLMTWWVMHEIFENTMDVVCNLPLLL